ncbi:MAG: hypothetical protein J6S38_00455 [Erysipelotrichaceae bacterium]|nr:hypothetical protein [Erysipelotrichaceae bacterium]
MALKGKTIKSRITGITGKITGIDNKSLKITFSGFQDISVPLGKVEKLLIMDKETLAELKDKINAAKEAKEESRVKTYIDSDDETNE